LSWAAGRREKLIFANGCTREPFNVLDQPQSNDIASPQMRHAQVLPTISFFGRSAGFRDMILCVSRGLAADE
jgi:hypothetical protein